MTRDLVLRAQSGDHDAFEALASSVVRRLHATASLIVRDADIASDVVQEALIEVWRDLPALRDPDAFEAWCRRILVRRCYRAVNESRRRRLEVRGLETDAPSPSHEMRISDSDQLERAFRRLPVEQRAVLSSTTGKVCSSQKQRAHWVSRSERSSRD